MRIPFVNEKRLKKKPLPSLLMTNARSVFNKMDELRLRVLQHKPSVIAITETWLSPNTPDSAIAINGYQSYRMDRNSHGGGILCYLRSDWPSNVINPSLTSCSANKSEFLFIFVKCVSLAISSFLG